MSYKIFFPRGLDTGGPRDERTKGVRDREGEKLGIGKWGTKKGGTNGIAVRAGRPVTQTTSGFGGVYESPPQPE